MIIAIVLGFRSRWCLRGFMTSRAMGSSRHERLSGSGRKNGGTFAFTDRSIAVLPFTDLSPDQDHAYFSDGVAEEI